MAEFYIFYNNIKKIQAFRESLKKVLIKEESASDLDEPDVDVGEAIGFDDDGSDSDQKPLQSLVKAEIKELSPSVKIKKSVTHESVAKDDKCWWENNMVDVPVPKKRARKVHTYHCDICGRSFKKYNFIKAHIQQKHLGIFEDVCPHCGKTSFDKSTLKRHIDAVHLKTYKRRRDICPDCGISVVALKLHRRLKHGIGEKVEKVMHTCDICSLQYTKSMYLKRHVARKHLKQFNDKCPFCQKDFYNRMSVERHMQSQHPDLVPEEVKKKRLVENITSPCDLCEKVFHRRTNYLRHRKTVHKEAPFSTSTKVKPESPVSQTTEKGRL